MDSTIPTNNILSKVNDLITFSCKDFPETSLAYTSMHKGIIKVYFEAKNVEIDYENKKIKADIPVTPQEYTRVSFQCQDLTRFLKSCIKKDKKSLMFYQNIINYHNKLEVA